MHPQTDIAIIGAGAAGLAAAIFAAQARPELKITLLDGAKKIGAKILVSGGGRCNVTHAKLETADFHAPHRLVNRILTRFDQPATVKWFNALGVKLKQEDTGKLFPTTDSAHTVLNALLNRCEQLNINILTNHRVTDVSPIDHAFIIRHTNGTLTTRRVVMATGGKSLPKTGSDGQAYAIAKHLGHTITHTRPALVPLVLDDTFFHADLSGISHPATLTTRVNHKIIDRRTGSLLWTHFGISGPVAMDASCFWTTANPNAQDQTPTLSLACLPDQDNPSIDQWLTPNAAPANRKTVLTTLAQRLPSRLAKALCTHLQKSLPTTPDLARTPLSQLPRTHRKAITKALTNLPLPVTRHRGWNYAEVTAGGIPLAEVDTHTMSSRKTPGLYLIGELLDCDARIGGFNFQWAWSTAHIAGTAAATQHTNKPNPS